MDVMYSKVKQSLVFFQIMLKLIKALIVQVVVNPTPIQSRPRRHNNTGINPRNINKVMLFLFVWFTCSRRLLNYSIMQSCDWEYRMSILSESSHTHYIRYLRFWLTIELSYLCNRLFYRVQLHPCPCLI